MNKYFGGIIVGVIVGVIVYKLSEKTKTKVEDNVSKMTVEKDIDFKIENNEVITINSDSFKDAEKSIVRMNEQFDKEINNETINELEKQQTRDYDIF